MEPVAIKKESDTKRKAAEPDKKENTEIDIADKREDGLSEEDVEFFSEYREIYDAFMAKWNEIADAEQIEDSKAEEIGKKYNEYIEKLKVLDLPTYKQRYSQDAQKAKAIETMKKEMEEKLSEAGSGKFWIALLNSQDKEMKKLFREKGYSALEKERRPDFWIAFLGSENKTAKDNLKPIWEPFIRRYLSGNPEQWKRLLEDKKKKDEVLSKVLEAKLAEKGSFPVVPELIEAHRAGILVETLKDIAAQELQAKADQASEELIAIRKSSKSDDEKKAAAKTVYERDEVIYTLLYEELISSIPVQSKGFRNLLDNIKKNNQIYERTKYLGIRILVKINRDFPEFESFIKDFQIKDMGNPSTLGGANSWKEGWFSSYLNPYICFNTYFFERMKLVDKIATDKLARDFIPPGINDPVNNKFKSRVSADFDATVAHEAGHLLAFLLSRKHDVKQKKDSRHTKSVDMKNTDINSIKINDIDSKRPADRVGEAKILHHVALNPPIRSQIKANDLIRAYTFDKSGNNSDFDEIMKEKVGGSVKFGKLTAKCPPNSPVKKFVEKYNGQIHSKPLALGGENKFQIVTKKKAAYIDAGTNLTLNKEKLEIFVSRCPYSWGIEKTKLSGYASSDICETVAEAFGDYYTAFHEAGKDEKEQEEKIFPLSRDIFHAYQKVYGKWKDKVTFKP